VAEVLTNGESVHLTSEAGTDLTASIKGFRYKHPSALARIPGELGYYNAGEAGGGPLEGTANGVIVVDGSIQNICDKPYGADPPVRLYVENGKIKKVEGGSEAEIIRDVIKRVEGADNLAELSVGINPYIKLTGKTSVTDKNVYGTVHVAIGENVFQIYPLGTVRSPIHWDMILRKPTLKVDGKVLVENGDIVSVKFPG
jgi:leucyl aminopeptidase (aminopeptidase T)